MKVSWKHYTGHLAHLQPWLRRRVRVFTKKWCWVKIGITNNPKIRADQHERVDPDWELMVVLWETNSVRMIRLAERVTIENLA
ncbi:MAG: hypothetical protein F4Z14_03555 [Gammaproteobacteria bacterium]|nr:hypothetical protein [Gammaproteobacteria bacterium]